MKLIVIFASLLLIPLLGFSQKKLIQNGLKKGRSYDCLYTAINYGNKVIKEANVYKYCQENKIIVQNLRTKSTNQFGGSATTVASFNFLPESEAEDYLLHKVMGREVENCKSVGKGYYYEATTVKAAHYNNEIKWSGSVTNGKINGTGLGYFFKNSNTVYWFKGKFVDGKPVGNVKFNVYSLYYQDLRTVCTITDSYDVSDFFDDLAFIEKNSKYCLVNSNFDFVTGYVFRKVIKPFKNGTAEVIDNNWKEIIIDTKGLYVDLTAHQKQMDEDERQRKAAAEAEARRKKAEAERIAAEKKAEEERIAAEKRAEEERIAAEKRAEEERIAAEKKAAKEKYEKECFVNSNPKLWQVGDRLVYVHDKGIVTATIEEWNPSKTNVKLKIVTSPSYNITLDGDVLEKNNTIWVSAKAGGKWHLPVGDEIAQSIAKDNSVKPTNTSSSSSSYSSSYSSSSSYDKPKYRDCDKCRGSGRRTCGACGGDGIEGGLFTRDHVCHVCKGKGEY